MDEHQIHFNHIFIVQSLRLNDAPTGAELANFIDAELAKSSYQKMKCSFVDVGSKKQLISWMQTLPQAFRDSQIVPYLHLEIHGCEDGLELTNGDLVLWEELTPLLREINRTIENNLFLSLATCFGAFLFKAVDLLDRIPFFGFVGPVHEIFLREVRSDWVAYFQALLENGSFTKAIIALNETNKRIPYAFLTSEEIFDKLSNIVGSAYQSRQLRRKKRNELIRTAWKNPKTRENNTRASIETYFTNYVSRQPQFMEHIRDYFLYRTDTPALTWMQSLFS